MRAEAKVPHHIDIDKVLIDLQTYIKGVDSLCVSFNQHHHQ
jgi:hypothetical protein